MQKKHLLIPLFLAGSFTTYAQVSAVQTLNKNYQDGLELLQKEKYTAASQQFKLVQQKTYRPSTQLENSAELSLIKENAKFYAAVCALQLTNSDAEDLFRNFIRDYPLNPNTKLAYFYVGKSYFDQKNYTKALEWFEKADPSTLSGSQRLEYQFKEGYAYFEQQNYDKAEPLFESVKKEKGEFQESATYYFAYINYLNKEYKTALANFEKLKGSPTYEASYPYYITSMYYLDERYDDVIDYGLSSINKTKQQFEPEIYSLVAASYFAKNDFKNAEKYFREFYAGDKSNTKNNLFIYQYGYALDQNKKPKEAVAVLEKLSADDVYLQSGMYSLGKIYLELGDKAKAQSAFFRASRLDFDKNVKEEAWLAYAKLSYELNYSQQALDATQSFLKQFPNSRKIKEAKTLLGEVLLTTKNYQAAVDILQPIVEDTPEAESAYQKVTYFRGLEFYNERAFPNALSMFLRSEKYPKDNEISALATYWKAESMYELRKYGESVQTFEKFLKMPDADKTGVYNFANYALAYAAFEGEKYGKAASYFEKFLAGNDKDQKTIDDATIRLADSYFVEKKYDAAMADYNTIINRKTDAADYALFQKGMIQGLQTQYDAKIATMQSLLNQYPKSNYADDAGFETAYTYFNKGDFDKSKSDLTDLIAKYPRSSYVAKALVTIGLVQYNQNEDDAATTTFKKVIADYPSADEAKQAMESIKNIYLDKGDANGFIAYAQTTPLGNYSNSEQDNIVFSAANNLYLQGKFPAAYLAINAYFDKFPKSIHEKQAKFIRAESLVKMDRPDEAIPDYEFILNDWTSDYTEQSLVSISQLFLDQKKYNEAIVYLKRLETTTDYKSHYGFAINNLLKAYTALNMPDDMLKYAKLVKESGKASEEEKYSAGLYEGKAYLLKGDTTNATTAFKSVVDSTKTIAAAESEYNLALLEYNKRQYKTSTKSCFKIINDMASYDYWVAKAFILLSDNYAAQGDILQAKSTLLSIIDNYATKDDIIPAAKEKLEKLNKKK